MDDTTLASTHSRSLPDACVEKNVADALRTTGRFSSTPIEVFAAAGVVRLRGRVESYYQKQIAQVVAAKVIGSCRLVNDVEVS